MAGKMIQAYWKVVDAQEETGWESIMVGCNNMDGSGCHRFYPYVTFLKQHPFIHEIGFGRKHGTSHFLRLKSVPKSWSSISSSDVAILIPTLQDLVQHDEYLQMVSDWQICVLASNHVILSLARPDKS